MACDRVLSDALLWLQSQLCMVASRCASTVGSSLLWSWRCASTVDQSSFSLFSAACLLKDLLRVGIGEAARGGETARGGEEASGGDAARGDLVGEVSSARVMTRELKPPALGDRV
mmetsp:Transcript_9344/g.23948  ORF Transcript_9344/g.23948 Transcript_9344/m.23948 type:complete len:115 (+) Transcript_9344:1235-1579(+)